MVTLRNRKTGNGKKLDKYVYVTLFHISECETGLVNDTFFENRTTLLLPGGKSYVGDLNENGEPDGCGRLYWIDEVIIYSGGVNRYARPEGYGAVRYPDGYFYKGDFVNGTKEGQGFLMDPGLLEYTGGFHAERRHGYGKNIYYSGSVSTYEGLHNMDRPHGPGGRVVFRNGVVFRGTLAYGGLTQRGNFTINGTTTEVPTWVFFIRVT